MQEMTIPAMLAERARQTPEAPGLFTDQGGNWHPVAWSEYWDKAAGLAHGMARNGLPAGSPIGIMAKTSREWEYVQMAVLMNKGVVVGIDPHDTQENVNFIAQRAGLRGLVVEHPDLLDTFTTDVKNQLVFTAALGGTATSQGRCHLLADLIDPPLPAGQTPPMLCTPDDPATIIFTSGTTGRPKGIQYTHAQVIAACNSIVRAFQDISQDWRLVCWLPLSNLFQRMLNFCAIRSGAQTYIVQNPKDVVRLLPAINPHVFIGVPRFYEKLHEGILRNVEEKGPAARWLFRLATTVGHSHATALRENRRPGLPTRLIHPLLDRLVLGRVRSVLGSSMRFMVSGSAAMPLDLLEKYHALGLLVLEAYGISENVIPVALNTPQAYRFGSVGRPLPENTLRFADDGEILIKGPGVCSSYFAADDEPDTADKTVNQEGFLATSDLGQQDKDGFLHLTGRKSELFKTSTGRRISPVRIEERLRASRLVEQAMVVGENRKYLVAILALSDTGTELLASQNQERPDSPNRPAPNALERLNASLSDSCRELPGYQQPVGYVLTTRGFSIQNNELTANLKLKRKNILATYAQAIAALDEMIAGTSRQGPSLAPFASDVFLVTL